MTKPLGWKPVCLESDELRHAGERCSPRPRPSRGEGRSPKAGPAVRRQGGRPGLLESDVLRCETSSGHAAAARESAAPVGRLPRPGEVQGSRRRQCPEAASGRAGGLGGLASESGEGEHLPSGMRRLPPGHGCGAAPSPRELTRPRQLQCPLVASKS
jgi:hypothetical protein